VNRRAIAVAALAVVAFFAVTLVTLTHVITNSASGCSIEAPTPSLPASLRSVGGFDQTFDATNAGELVEVGQNAAAVVSPDLDGATPTEPVNVAATAAGQPAAIVVPFTSQESNGTRLVGLVSFFVGCGERAYFGSVMDISQPGTTAPSTFPAVSESAAARQLDTSTPQLVYTSSPFNPEWRNAQSGATVSAGE
jgi:hypothetical protein